MDINNLKGLMEAYQQVHAPQEVDEGKVELDQERRSRMGRQIGKKVRSAEAEYSLSKDTMYPKGLRGAMEKGARKKVGQAQKIMGALKSAQKEEFEIDEATAMAKRGYDEAPIRQKIAKSTGGGEAADRASALEKKSTFGDAKKAKQRTDYARKQRGDFRKTTSSSPGLHGYAHKSDDAGVKAKQAARGAQRGALTPAEKKQFNREEFDIFDTVLEFLYVEGYAETLEEAEWMMANIIDEEAIDIILEAMHDEEEEIDEQQRPIYSRGGEQRRTQTPRQIGVKGAVHNIPKGGTTISDRDPEGKRLFSGEQDRGKGSKAARRAAALKPQEKRFPNRLRRADGQGIRDSYEMSGNSLNAYEAFESWLDEAMTNYEKNRKRAAQRAAARNEARKQGKTGAVPGVGYVTPRPERETWTDESGKTRHAKGL